MQNSITHLYIDIDTTVLAWHLLEDIACAFCDVQLLIGNFNLEAGERFHIHLKRRL